MLELMIVVAILAVLAALAAPSFKDTIERVRAESAAEAMTSTMYYARSEAIRRGGAISVRKSCSNGAPPKTNADWDCGWIVATDANGNNVEDGTDVVLRRFEALSNMNMVATFNSSSLTFDRWGQPNTLGLGFIISAAPSATQMRAFCVSSGGRIRVIKDTNTCT
jgi:type IV fimbrial biogenesis protein FimT